MLKSPISFRFSWPIGWKSPRHSKRNGARRIAGKHHAIIVAYLLETRWSLTRRVKRLHRRMKARSLLFYPFCNSWSAFQYLPLTAGYLDYIMCSFLERVLYSIAVTTTSPVPHAIKLRRWKPFAPREMGQHLSQQGRPLVVFTDVIGRPPWSKRDQVSCDLYYLYAYAEYRCRPKNWWRLRHRSNGLELIRAISRISLWFELQGLKDILLEQNRAYCLWSGTNWLIWGGHRPRF